MIKTTLLSTTIMDYQITMSDQQAIPGSSSIGGTRQQTLAAKACYPPGYRFMPTDYELIFHLKNKIRNGPILIEEIKDVDLYKTDPKTLSEVYLPLGDKEWYFFTSRNRKYANGSRPDRTAGGGYWKATGADKRVYFEGRVVGLKKTLVFYQGKHQTSIKTNWIMHEFRIDKFPQRSRRDANDMKLDDWVLCRIHEKVSRLRGNQQEDHDQVDETTSNSQSVQQVINNTQIDEIVDNNEEDPDRRAAVQVNHQDNVAIACSTAAVVNHYNDGNLAALGTPEYVEMDEELRPFIDLTDYHLPSMEDVLNTSYGM